MTRWANSATVLRFRTPARLYSCETLLEQLPQNLQHMAAALGQFILEEQAVVGQRHFPGIGMWRLPISPASERVWRDTGGS